MLTPETAGEPLPTLDTDAYGAADELVNALLAAVDALGVDVRLVDDQA